MLLDRIDIDNHGPLKRVELGPFSEFLNAVCMPEGSGKTALMRFVRDSLVRREYPLGMMSSSAGRVVWADRNGKIHCRREHDGTPSGRRTVEFETRGESPRRYDWLHGSWINGIADSTDASRALEAIRIPESIVDGIVTDTAVTSVSRVIAACLAGGLNDPALFASLPIGTSAVSGLSPQSGANEDVHRRAMRDELARIEAELATLQVAPATRSEMPYGVESRRRQLLSRLGFLRSRAAESSVVTASDARGVTMQNELQQMQERIWQLRVRHGELSRWLSHLQADRSRARYTAPITAAPYANHRSLAETSLQHTQVAASIDGNLRRLLLETDAQIARWRRVAAEISGLRETIHADSYRAQIDRLEHQAGQLPLSDAWLYRQRMDYLLGSLDLYRHTAAGPLSHGGEGFARTELPSYWPDEIDLRVEAITRQIDQLAHFYSRPTSPEWYQGMPADAFYRAHLPLAETLLALRDDIANTRRYGFRFAHPAANVPASAAAQSLAVHREHRLFDLRRAERWVTATIEQLLRHREQLIRDRQYADQLRYPSWLHPSHLRDSWSGWYVEHLDREVVTCSKELDQTTAELDRWIQRAAQLRGLLAASPASGPGGTALESEASIHAEIASLEEALFRLDQEAHVPSTLGSTRLEWLLKRRDELTDRLGVQDNHRIGTNPLADEASQWLVRLSGGRLRRVDWDPSDFTTLPERVAQAGRQGFAVIDGRAESVCCGLDRALATLAIRLAAGDLLARTDRPIPLVIEAQRELLRPAPETFGGDETIAAATMGPVNLAVIAALDDYAKNGRQVIVLASDAIFAEQIARRGGQVFYVHGERVSHEHRPLFQPHFGNESFVGPYTRPESWPSDHNPLHRTDAYVNQYYDEFFDNMPLGDSLAEINRNLDAIWQEAYGVSPHTRGAASYPNAPTWDQRMDRQSAAFDARAYDRRTPPQAAGPWHDGYYFTDLYTTSQPAGGAQPSVGTHAHAGLQPDLTGQRHGPSAAASTSRHMAGGESFVHPSHLQHATGGGREAVPFSERSSFSERSRVSPFFLTVDSPIDQAPSVDAVAASRLRRLDVTHINHLMNQDPNRLADALGLAGVSAATIRRWQSECRLVCNVPQLRGFDARVLVGCGISDPDHLASTDPNDLLDRVEAFLATERGQRILLSGTSYELSRITSWIAAANVGTDEVPAVGGQDYRTIDGRVVGNRNGRGDNRKAIDHDQYEYEFVDDAGHVVRARSKRNRGGSKLSRTVSRQRQTDSRGNQTDSRGNQAGRSGNRTRSRGSSHGNAGAGRPLSDRAMRGDGTARRTVRRSAGASETGSRGSLQTSQSRRESMDGSARFDRDEAAQNAGQQQRRDRQRNTADHAQDTESELRFYLSRESPVVDAPSIGARMAERLETVGIITVDDLLNADAMELAEQLDHRRIDADVITAWQNQAILVCRIPMLRGHDAQLLVAADVTTPEDVANYDAHDLFALIDPISKSNEGQRILRGGKLPDLEEITEWIHYAGLHRELVAA